MDQRRRSRWLAGGLAAVLLSLVWAPPRPAAAAPWAGNRTAFAAPAFERLWRSADEAVQAGTIERSWTWGPRPWFDYREFYRQAPNGLRPVQYFDKSRMEINDPAADPQSPWYVTNGLLAAELVSGRLKLGDGTGPDQYEQRLPADIPVAGDLVGNIATPTYASFRQVATIANDNRAERRLGQRVGTTLTSVGSTVQLGFDRALTADPATEIVVYDEATGHNVPRVFEDFRQAGPVPAIVAFGYPITDPYWIRAPVAGQGRTILVQVFERRVITYTPANPPRFQVEMGNVGQHYFQWRYPHLGLSGMPWATADPPLPIVFASREAGGAFNIHLTEADWRGQRAITAGPRETLPFSLRRTWDAAEIEVFGDSRRFGDKRQLVRLKLDGRDLQRVLISDANDYHPAVSPDGAKVAFASDRDGNPELYLLNLGSTAPPTRLTDTTGCINQHPSWLPDGSGLVYESNCQGQFDIYRGSLRYTQDKRDELTLAALISPTDAARLTQAPADDRFPRVSPDGSLIAFTSSRDGNPEIYSMTIDGQRPRRLTDSPGVDEAPTWSPDGASLAFSSDRDGDAEIFRMNRDGGNRVQLTENSLADRYPLWAQ